MSSVAASQSKGSKSIVDSSTFTFDNLLVRPPRVVNGKAGQRIYVSFATKGTNLPLYMKFEGWCGLGFTDPYIKTAPGVAPSKKQIDDAVSKASTYSYEISVPEDLLPELAAWDKFMPEYVFENRAILLAGSSILEEEDETILKKMIARAYKPIIKYSKKDVEKKYPKMAVCFRRMNFERHTGKMSYTQEEKAKNMVLEIFENGKPKQVKNYDDMKNFIKAKSKVSQLITFDFWRLNDSYGIKVMTNNINALPRQSSYQAPTGNVWDTDGSVSQQTEDNDPYAQNPDDYTETQESAPAEEEASASVEDSEENLEAEIEADASDDDQEKSEELAAEEEADESEPEVEEEPEPVKAEPVKKTVRRTATKKATTAKTK